MIVSYCYRYLSLILLIASSRECARIFLVFPIALPFFSWKHIIFCRFRVVVQLLTHVWLCNTRDWSTPGIHFLRHLLVLAQTHVHWVSDAIQLSHSLLPPSPPALSLSQHHWSFPVSQLIASGGQSIGASASAFSPSHQYSGLISFRIDWFDLLAVKGTLESFLQRHSLEASILWYLAFFMVQLSHPYMTTGKTIALTIWTFVNKVISLLF